MKDREDRPDPSALLEAFVASGRDERAFARLVENLGGLVYSSALRRAGNSQLAEEITQNVFAIMARKAESLRRHPSLTAWALETTRLQSASAMRSEKRRRRKVAALAREAEARTPASSPAMKPEPAWKEAVHHLDEALDRLPEKDRALILQRFYEDRKFREIAAANGQTEAACKMRLKRALEKIATLLTARGVTLSVTALASSLGAEFARSAPAHTLAAIAPKALTASSSLSATAVLANTFQTMSTLKSTTLTAAAVLAIAAIPFSQQHAEGRRIQSELRSLEPDRESPAVRNGPQSLLGGRTARREPARTAQSLLATFERPVNNRALIRSLITGDALDETAALARINEMSPEEITALLEDLRRFPIDDYVKPLSTVERFAPDQSPRASLERMVAGSVTSGYDRGGSSPLSGWARSEPDAALAWYREKRASGELYSGFDDDLPEDLIGDLLVGLAESSPAQAFGMYREVPREEMNGAVPRWMGSAYAKGIMESGDETFLAQMLDFHSGEDRRGDRRLVLSGAFGEFARAGRFDEGMALVDRHNQVPEERYDYVEDLFGPLLHLGQLEGGIDWVLASTQNPEVMERMFYAFARRNRTMAQEWVNRQEPGLVRDVAHAAVARRMAYMRNYPEALTNVESINDATRRAEALRAVGQRWLKRDPESAEQELPAELLEQLQNQ